MLLDFAVFIFQYHCRQKVVALFVSSNYFKPPPTHTHANAHVHTSTHVCANTQARTRLRGKPVTCTHRKVQSSARVHPRRERYFLLHFLFGVPQSVLNAAFTFLVFIFFSFFGEQTHLLALLKARIYRFSASMVA